MTALSRSTLFADLTSAELASSAGSLRWVEYTRGAHIWLEGDAADRLYVVVSGQVRLYRLGADGEEITVEVYMGGEHFGERKRGSVPFLSGTKASPQTLPPRATTSPSSHLAGLA